MNVSWAIAILTSWLLPPLLDGIGRKIKAKIQGRRGPPILQTYYDIISLLRMPSSLPTRRLSFRIAPYLAFSSVIASSLVLPFGKFPISFSWDFLVLIYVAGIVSVSLMMAGFSLDNFYANAGANREMMMLLTLEPLLALSIAIFALNSHSLSLKGIMSSLRPLPSLAFSYCLLAYVSYLEAGFLPYDIPEAETEIIEGALCEYSGSLLGVFKAALLGKRFIFIWLLSSFLIIPWISAPWYLILAIQYSLTFLIYSLCSLIEALSARKRIREVISENWKAFGIGLIGLLLAGLGW